MMLLMVSLKSRRRLVEDENEDEGLGRCRGTCCSFNVSPGRRRRDRRMKQHTQMRRRRKMEEHIKKIRGAEKMTS